MQRKVCGGASLPSLSLPLLFTDDGVCQEARGLGWKA